MGPAGRAGTGLRDGARFTLSILHMRMLMAGRSFPCPHIPLGRSARAISRLQAAP